MPLFKQILVPVDGSIYSRDAVRLSARIASVHGSNIKIIHVLDVLLVEQLRRLSKKTKETVQVELRHAAHGFLRDMEREVRLHNVHPEVLIEEGIPHEAILKEASACRADLIVMGKLGRRGISHIVLGSVTERVIEFSDSPVLVVK